MRVLGFIQRENPGDWICPSVKRESRKDGKMLGLWELFAQPDRPATPPYGRSLADPKA
jgi:hypothetical protein